MPYTGTWTKITRDDTLKRSSHSLSVLNSDLYIFGGELHPRQPRDGNLHKFALGSDSPSVFTLPIPQSSSPSPRVGTALTSLPLPSPTLYLFSGRGGEAMTPLDESGRIWTFSPSTSTWSSLNPIPTSPIPEARSYHSLTSDGVKTLYLHAGCPAKGRVSDLWAFDVEGRSWKELAPAPGKGRGGTSIAWAGGRLWRVNGFDGEREIGGKLDVYDAGMGEWETREYKADGVEGPGARSVGALVPVRMGEGADDVVLVTVFGEGDPSSLGHAGAGKMLGDGWGYSIKEKRWERIEFGGGERPQARGWFGADKVTVGGKDHVAVVGGLGESNERLDDAWLLSIA